MSSLIGLVLLWWIKVNYYSKKTRVEAEGGHLRVGWDGSVGVQQEEKGTDRLLSKDHSITHWEAGSQTQ